MEYHYYNEKFVQFMKDRDVRLRDEDIITYCGKNYYDYNRFKYGVLNPRVHSPIKVSCVACTLSLFEEASKLGGLRKEHDWRFYSTTNTGLDYYECSWCKKLEEIGTGSKPDPDICT